MQISAIQNINRQTYTINKSNSPVYAKPQLKTDVFEKNSNIAFKGVEGLFKKAPNFVPRLEILPKVSEEFITKVTKQISEFSPEWLEKFKNNNYKIILSPTISDAYKSQNIFDLTAELFEKQNPKGSLAATYTQGRFGKNFFVFCDKAPDSNLYTQAIVNHELSHGVINITELDKTKKTIELLKKHVGSIIKERKLDKLTPDEREMVSHYFFNKNAYLPIDEILADLYAWNKGQGCYGSEVILGIKNPNLMKNLFPNTSEFLKTI